MEAKLCDNLKVSPTSENISSSGFPGAEEDELDPVPWLNASALISLTAFICSLIVYKIVKSR